MPEQVPVATLNNGITLPALDRGVHLSEPPDTAAAVAARRRCGGAADRHRDIRPHHRRLDHLPAVGLFTEEVDW